MNVGRMGIFLRGILCVLPGCAAHRAAVTPKMPAAFAADMTIRSGWPGIIRCCFRVENIATVGLPTKDAGDFKAGQFGHNHRRRELRCCAEFIDIQRFTGKAGDNALLRSG